jgi:uridine kinase
MFFLSVVMVLVTLPRTAGGIEWLSMNSVSGSSPVGGGSAAARPYFIGIAGGSCSGKTTIARGVVRRLSEKGAALISIDSYYHGLVSASPGDIEKYNFDDPSALDSALIFHHLRELAAGRAVDIPVYDFKTHTRTPRVDRVEPVSYIIIEGLFPLYWEEVRSLLRTGVFVDVAHAVCLERRLRRDTHERGRPRDEVIRRYNEMARPMYEKYVLPSRQFADVIVDGQRPVGESVDAVLDYARGKKG